MRHQNPTIRMGEMGVVRDNGPLRALLGSCVGIALYDRQCKVAGLAHAVLPKSRGLHDLVAKYVDTAIPALLNRMTRLADDKLKPTAKIAGGANMFATTTSKTIGTQNVEACELLLHELRIPIVAKHCGGEKGRRITLDSETGLLTIEVVGAPSIEL